MAHGSSLIAKVRNANREHALFEKGDKLLVAVSGGFDSIVLLHVLVQLREELGLDLVAAHVDHGFRGEESAGDARFVEEIGEKWGVPVHARCFDVTGYAQEKKLSTQVAAREVRYAYLEQVARETGAAKILTAHHADDQAETVLMRVLRGTTPRGVAGIRRKREQNGILYMRPLLDVWRSEIEAYAQQHQLSHREDSSNASTKYIRNKIRIRLLPLLAEEYNAGVKEALLQLAQLSREDDDYLNALAEEAFHEMVEQQKPSRLRVDAKQLAGTALPLQRRLITLILYYLRGNTVSWEQVHIESIRSLLLSPVPSGEVHLPDGVIAWREYESLYFGDASERQTDGTDGDLEAWSYFLTDTGDFDVTLPACGIRLEGHFVEGVPPHPQDAWEVQFDADELSGSCIYIRIWARGDTLRPLGMQGRKRVSDALGEAKIPKARRAAWPLLCIDDAIAWVVGVRRGQQALVTGRTRRALVLRATPIH